VVLSVVLVFVPDLAGARHGWLLERVTEGQIAGLAADPGFAGVARGEMLRLSGVVAVRLRQADGTTRTLAGTPQAEPTTDIDLRREGQLLGALRAMGELFRQPDGLIQVTADSVLPRGGVIEVLLPGQALSETLRRFALHSAWPPLLVASATGALVYLALLFLLVRPMQRITESIAAFRANPEATPPLDPKRVTWLPDDEMAHAGRELAALQRELRATLWRNARLAALGTAVAKVSHDLRGILAPALISADRLQDHEDPVARRAGETMLRAVDRVTDVVRRTLSFVSDGPPPTNLGTVALARLVDEAADTTRPLSTTLRIDNEVFPDLLVTADRNQLFRVLANLMRNAAEAGAERIGVRSGQLAAMLTIDLTDDGPGLPAAVRENLFRPFAGSMRRGGTGLGLAIARDLMLAHGGDIGLLETGAHGTTFRLTLPMPDRDLAPPETERVAERTA
jgi:signal transduction histidine kinase